MTIIAIKNGIMAADSLLSSNDCVINYTKKIFKSGQFVIGLAGTWTHCLQFLKWFESEEKEKISIYDLVEVDNKKDLSVTALVYDTYSKRLFEYNDSTIPIEINEPFYATGSGWQFAIGAMEQGATAEKACKIACNRVLGCGGKIQKVKLT